MSHTETLLKEIRAEFPSFRVVSKRDSRFSRCIDLALKMITLGAQRQYMTHYHTVIGHTLYVPETWDHTPDIHRVITLRHERVHLRQGRRYTSVGLALVYLLPFFPLGFAYGRARIEWEAYTETLRATAELLGLEQARSARLREHIVKQFVSGSYGWMWPFRNQVERWYAEALAAIEQQSSSSPVKTGNVNASLSKQNA